MKKRLAILIASGLGLGYLPKAPGTWGSVGGLALAYVCFIYSVQPLLIALCLTGLAYASIEEVEKVWGEDNQKIVVDEVAGQFLAVGFFPTDFTIYLIGFVAFRILDITKIGPIGFAERHAPKTWNTLLDDLIAGLMAAAIVGTAEFARVQFS